LQRLQLKTNTPIHLKDIEEAVHRLFGSMSFTKVTYHFNISPSGSEYTTLHVVLLEAPSNMVKLGFRYDNIRGPSLLAGLTMRNLLHSNSEFTVNLDLSMLPIVDVQYRFSPVMGRSTKKGYSIWKPTLFASYTFCNLKIYDYNIATDSAKIFRDTEYSVIGNRGAIGAEFNVKSNTLGLGLYLDHTVSNERVGGTGTGQRLSALYLYPQFYYLRNSFNKRYYPTKGTIINVRVRLLHALDRNTPRTTWVRTSGTYYFDVQQAISFSKRLTLYPSAMIAGTLVFQEKDMSTGHISQQQQFYQGGLFHIPHVNQTLFVGLHFMQKVGLYGANVQINTQYQVFKNFFLTARIGALKSESDYSEMFDLRNTTFGAGISASINTTIGPIGVTVHGSNDSPVGVFINLGFWL
jgi:outer membrane protein assembly factor BamA